MQGELRAGIDLPEDPAVCFVKEKHAELTPGKQALVALDEERAALDRQHQWQDVCNEYRADFRKKMRKAPVPE